MHVIVGLGNPGSRYEHTRHNAGFLAVDAIARHYAAPPFRLEKKYNALATTIQHGQETYLLLKPQTFMNRSGEAVQAALAYHHVLPKHLHFFTKKDADLQNVLTVIHDDVDFELGTVKLQTNRNAGGHNGITSIIHHLKTKNFRRVRIGVRTPRKEQVPTESFVLERFSADEEHELAQLWPRVIEQTLAA